MSDRRERPIARPRSGASTSMVFDETTDGSNDLSGLRQSESPAAAAAGPARVPEEEAATELGAGGTAPLNKPGGPAADTRKSPRYPCKGSVRLQENGSTVTTSATFADISMHECYVEATTPLRVRTVVDLQLSVNGFRVEAPSEVRVAYPSLGRGISFNEISEQDRARLRELVRSISPASVIVSPRVAVPSHTIPQSEGWPGIANPGAALQAILSFFEDRRIIGPGRVS